MKEDASGKQQRLCCCMVFNMFLVETSQTDKLPSLCFLSKVHLTCLQFFVPISRAMEQKLLKYVPCNTLNSDSSAPLHWTTEDSCSVTSSSPGRNLVGVWQREFPSVIHTHMTKERKKRTEVASLHGKKDVRYSLILVTTAHSSPSYRIYQDASVLNLLFSCCHAECVRGHTCIGSHGDLSVFAVIQLL